MEKNNYLKKYLKYKQKYINLTNKSNKYHDDKSNKYNDDKSNKYNNDITLFIKNKSENKKFKIVSDSLGEITVPKDKYWGGITARYLKYFPNNFPSISLDLIKNYAIVKKCASIVNEKNNLIDKERSKVIQQVCDEIINGKLDDNFPIKIWQTGSGTTTNMNVNEVISNRANQIIFSTTNDLNENNYIHPNDHVNKSQSSNDTFPTTLHICFVRKIITKLQPILQKLIYTLNKKSIEFAKKYKIGRTHLQDAIPITFGQEFSGYKSLIETNFNSIMDSLYYLYELAIGGTAVGTGANTINNFGKLFSDEVNKYFSNINDDYNEFIIESLTKDVNIDIFKNLATINFIDSPNKFAALSANNSMNILSSSLKNLAINLIKIANDIRLMDSGPKTGFNEINIQENEPGSSIMPGKVNPTQAEVIIMVGIEVITNDLAVSFCGSQGNFELNVCRPLIFYKINESIDLLIDFIIDFNDNLLSNITLNNKQIQKNLHNSIIIATLMNNEIGYENVSKIVKYSIDNDINLEETCKKFGYSDIYNKIIKPIL